MKKRLLLAFVGIVALGSCDGRSKYASSCSSPLPGWRTPGNGWHNLYRNQVTIAENGKLAWNGIEVSRPMLRSYLAEIPRLNPYPATVLQAHPGADCATVHAVRKDIDDALTCLESQRCGEGNGEWDSGPFVDTNSAPTRELEELADRVANQGGDR